MNKFLTGFVVSSSNPDEFSLSLKGLLIANLGIIMFIVSYFKLPFTVEQVTDIIGVFSGLVGSAMLTYGLLRKLYYYFSPTK